MKILLFTDSMGAGGAQRQLAGLSVLLKNAGYDVKVCTYYPQDFYKQYLLDNNVPNETIPNAADSKKRIWAVRQYLLREKPNWVIAYQETPSIVACMCKLLGNSFNLIVSERNTTQKASFVDRLRFNLYRVAEYIVPNSYSQEKYLSKHYPWAVKKIFTITNFVDLEHFHYVEHKRHETRNILVVASIFHPKNTKGMIEAAQILKAKGCNFHIKWYGIAPSHKLYFNDCQSLIKKYGLERQIELLEKTTEIKEKYQEADYFCLPSFYEGTPNVICEAISTGVPVMCSAICDNHHYVEDNINGVLFDPTNYQNIADKISSFITQSDEAYQNARLHSREIAEKKLSKDTFLSKYTHLLEA